jgi:Protein of unknown function (DUF1579)
MSASVEQAAPSPVPQLAELACFTGTWEAHGTFHATPFSAEKPIAMRIDVDLVHRGFWIQTRTAEQPSPDNPNPLTATYLWGYDPDTDRFSAEWFDSNGGRATQTSTGWAGGRLVFIGQMRYGGYRFTLRDTFTRRGDDAYHHLGEVDLGQGWIPADEEHVHRRREREP